MTYFFFQHKIVVLFTCPFVYVHKVIFILPRKEVLFDACFSGRSGL